MKTKIKFDSVHRITIRIFVSVLVMSMLFYTGGGYVSGETSYLDSVPLPRDPFNAQIGYGGLGDPTIPGDEAYGTSLGLYTHQEYKEISYCDTCQSPDDYDMAQVKAAINKI